MNDRCSLRGEQNPAYGNLWFFFLMMIALIPQAAEAGTIALTGQPALRFYIDGDRLVLSGMFTIDNSGDEIAPEVKPEINVAGIKWVGDKRLLKPHQSEGWLIDASIPLQPEVLEGAYPMIARISYSDLNGYPFSNVTVFPLTLGVPVLGTARLLPLSVKVRMRPFSTQKFGADVMVYNLSQKLQEAKVSFITPKDLKVAPQSAPVKIEPGGFAGYQFNVENLTGLPGSVYLLYAVVEWKEDGRTQFSSTTVTFQLERQKHGFQWLIAGLIGAIWSLAALFMIAPAKTRVESPSGAGEEVQQAAP